MTASETTSIPAPTVLVNGKPYATELVNGVQRFVENTAVSFIVDNLSPEAYNAVVGAVFEGKVELEDYIAFQTMHGYSVSGFHDAITSNILLNAHLFPEELSTYYSIVNPLWDEETEEKHG